MREFHDLQVVENLRRNLTESLERISVARSNGIERGV
jgi:hypothetical protein